MISKLLRSGMVLALLAGGAYAADDLVSAVAGTVKSVDKAAHTVVVKTADGAEHTIHFVKKTAVHGADATVNGSKEAFQSMKEGDEIVVHYTEKGAVKTAREVDHVSKAGLQKAEVAWQSVDQKAHTVTVKTANGAEETYHMADSAVHETGKELTKGGKTTMYYTEEGGKKVVHFLKDKL